MRLGTAFVPILLSGLIISCAAPVSWTKPESTVAERRSDLTSCRRQAGAVTDERFGRRVEYNGSGGAGDSFQAAMLQNEATRYRDDLVDDCMRSKGYVRGR